MRHTIVSPASPPRTPQRASAPRATTVHVALCRLHCAPLERTTRQPYLHLTVLAAPASRVSTATPVRPTLPECATQVTIAQEAPIPRSPQLTAVLALQDFIARPARRTCAPAAQECIAQQCIWRNLSSIVRRDTSVLAARLCRHQPMASLATPAPTVRTAPPAPQPRLSAPLALSILRSPSHRFLPVCRVRQASTAPMRVNMLPHTAALPGTIALPARVSPSPQRTFALAASSAS